MAKGHNRSNREIRKPKKAVAEKNAGPAGATVSAAFAKPAVMEAKPKKR